jgi:hypothetical protein
MEHIFLVGADDVYRAACMMQQVAVGIQSAASNIESALQRHEQFLQQWLYDFQTIMEKKDA